MSSIEIRERLHIVSGMLKQQWSRVTHDEFQHAEGKFEETAARVQIQTREDYRRLKMGSWK